MRAPRASYQENKEYVAKRFAPYLRGKTGIDVVLTDRAITAIAQLRTFGGDFIWLDGDQVPLHNIQILVDLQSLPEGQKSYKQPSETTTEDYKQSMTG